MKSDVSTLRITLGALEARRGETGVFNRRRREFHVCRECRDRYGFEDSLFSKSGNVIFADFQKAREFTALLNAGRDPDSAVKAGDINAMGLMDEIFHHVIHIYLDTVNHGALKGALAECRQKMGREAVDKVLLEFSNRFPAEDVYRGFISSREYVSRESNLDQLVEELLMVWLANMNPAYNNARELFDHEDLKKHSPYQTMVGQLLQYFAQMPPLGPEGEGLIDFLRRPALESPHSLSGQLRYIHRCWGLYLEPFLQRLLQSRDLIKEEEKTFFAGPVGISLDDWRRRLRLEEGDQERFTADTDWMPNLVLMAKSTYVWLDQLSRAYERPIHRLDQIPDEELDLLADRGFTGLWLIGIWRRSEASAEIKRRCGNPEAMPSAYSIYAYEVSPDLGGVDALEQLKRRALDRGIRLGADMVPNHMGIDSPLVHHHPDWFIHRRTCPFPSYTFEGADLSSHPDVEIKIEDHYYDRSDAAVVFRWRHKHSGEVYYIYHGNDGTGLPWNDTAQFNYLLPQVRETVMAMILDVARQFPIVRFDAAMTLTQKHFRRLWFPQPGEGGDIPSRSEEGLGGEAFTRAMPREFWREVVERAATEAPDTLLLAEAFWLMESYFVRSLGMHRVYNSAFMNLLKNEDNGEYRTYMKNIIDFNPEVLRRYVNFMNNPDEDTAVAQFGKDDKYFGVCTLMATLPGLPMFGHGQLEGFTEKYGMEYRRAYLDETPDESLLDRHQWEISPLLLHRWLFSGVEHFKLYDFQREDGSIDENIFAFSNRVGDEGCLVIVHNRFADTSGRIGSSLAADLGFDRELGDFVTFTDQVTGLRYIRSIPQLAEEGLFVQLAAFKRHVFMSFMEVRDNQWRHYAQLHDALAGRGVPDLEEALQDIVLAPLIEAARTVADREFLDTLAMEKDLPEEALEKIGDFYRIARDFSGAGDWRSIVRRIEDDWSALPAPGPEPAGESTDTRIMVLLWWIFRRAGELAVPGDTGETAGLLWRQWRLGKVVEETFSSQESAPLLSILLRRHTILLEYDDGSLSLLEVVEQLFQDDDIKALLRINQYRGVIWFHKEGLETLLQWLRRLAVIHRPDSAEAFDEVKAVLSRLAAEAGYQADHFIAAVSAYDV